MPTCVVVLAESDSANQLNQKLIEASSPLTKFQLVHPFYEGENSLGKPQATTTAENTLDQEVRAVGIDSVQLLNPKLSKLIELGHGACHKLEKVYNFAILL